MTWLVECASVNRKALEIVANLPRELAELESAVRNQVAGVISRGRVNITIRSDAPASGAGVLKVDEHLAGQYLKALRSLGEKFCLSTEPSAAEITRWPGVFSLHESAGEPAAAKVLIERAVEAALAQLLTMRQAEGAHLQADIESRLQKLDELLTEIGRLAPAVPEQHRKQLRQRLADAGTPLPLDDERLVKEIALFADRCDISEELARAASHLKQFGHYITSAEPMGRSMDFLTQELAREFNTIGSKAAHAGISHLVVAAKTEIEKIREQVQNVE